MKVKRSDMNREVDWGRVGVLVKSIKSDLIVLTIKPPSNLKDNPEYFSAVVLSREIMHPGAIGYSFVKEDYILYLGNITLEND